MRVFPDINFFQPILLTFSSSTRECESIVGALVIGSCICVLLTRFLGIKMIFSSVRILHLHNTTPVHMWQRWDDLLFLRFYFSCSLFSLLRRIVWCGDIVEQNCISASHQVTLQCAKPNDALSRQTESILKLQQNIGRCELLGEMRILKNILIAFSYYAL